MGATEEEQWRKNAIEKLWKERESMGHTPLIKISVSLIETTYFWSAKRIS